MTQYLMREAIENFRSALKAGVPLTHNGVNALCDMAEKYRQSLEAPADMAELADKLKVITYGPWTLVDGPDGKPSSMLRISSDEATIILEAAAALRRAPSTIDTAIQLSNAAYRVYGGYWFDKNSDGLLAVHVNLDDKAPASLPTGGTAGSATNAPIGPTGEGAPLRRAPKEDDTDNSPLANAVRLARGNSEPPTHPVRFASAPKEGMVMVPVEQIRRWRDDLPLVGLLDTRFRYELDEILARAAPNTDVVHADGTMN